MITSGAGSSLNLVRLFSRGVMPRFKDIPLLRDPFEIDLGTADDRVSEGEARS